MTEQEKKAYDNLLLENENLKRKFIEESTAPFSGRLDGIKRATDELRKNLPEAMKVLTNFAVPRKAANITFNGNIYPCILGKNNTVIVTFEDGEEAQNFFNHLLK